MADTHEPTFTAERLLSRPDLVDSSAGDLAGAFHLAGIEPDAELKPSEVAELVEKFHGYVPVDAVPEPDPVSEDGEPSDQLQIGHDPFADVPAAYREANAREAVALLREPPEGVSASLLVAFEQAHDERTTVLNEARTLGLLAPDTTES